LVQIQHQGRREKFSLGTPVKGAAAARARDIYQVLLANGWQAALALLRPQGAPASGATVGDFLAELKASADLKPKTLEGYAKAFRMIVADIFEIGGGNEKCDYRGGGFQAWIERVHAVRLSEVTPATRIDSGPGTLGSDLKDDWARQIPGDQARIGTGSADGTRSTR
jgi:hypothetical protein